MAVFLLSCLSFHSSVCHDQLTHKGPTIISSRLQFKILMTISNFAAFSQKKGIIFHENGLLADDSHEISDFIFFRKLGKMAQNLSSAAVSVGALRVKFLFLFTWQGIFVLWLGYIKIIFTISFETLIVTTMGYLIKEFVLLVDRY